MSMYVMYIVYTLYLVKCLEMLSNDRFAKVRQYALLHVEGDNAQLGHTRLSLAMPHLL